MNNVIIIIYFNIIFHLNHNQIEFQFQNLQQNQ